MKLTLFIIALLSIATFTRAETFLSAKARKSASAQFAPSEFVSNLKKSEFGKTILSLASLQFKTSGKLDDVLNLLQGLKSKLQGQQSDDDQNYASTSANNNQIIADQTTIVTTATANIATYSEQLANAQSSLSQLQVSQGALQAEQDKINGDLDKNGKIRADQAARYAESIATEDLIIQGLQSTITVFSKAFENEEISGDSASRIKGLLDDLITAFQASQAQESQQEAQAIQDFEDWSASQQARLQEIADQLSSIALEISGLNALIGQLGEAIDAQTSARNNAQALHDRTVQAQSDLDQRYTSNKAVRTQQIQLLDSAVSTLSNNSANVQNYLNNA